MKVYISVDMEGIAGVNHPGPTDRRHERYPAAVELMVGETNAAIEGALAAGATDILVNDSHGEMYNLLPDRVHPAAHGPAGPEAVVDGPGRRTGRRVRRRPVRRLPRAGRPSDRHDRPHLLRCAGRDTPRWPADRRVRPERAGARGLGRAGRPRGGRRRPRRGGGVVAAVGRAGRRQGRGRRPRGGLGPSGRGDRPGPGGCRASRPPRGGWGAAACCASGRRRSSRSTTPAGSRPTSPRSSRARSASAIGASGSAPTTRLLRTAGSLRATVSPGPSTDIGGSAVGPYCRGVVPADPARPPPRPWRGHRTVAAGTTDSIVDVPNVRVGHQTVWRDEPPPPDGRGVARTGVTAIVPFGIGELFRSRVPAGAAVLNGAGEAIGITSIGEWGTLETPIFLTSSMAIGRVYDGAVAALVELDEIAGDDDALMPVVAECDDGWLNFSATRPGGRGRRPGGTRAGDRSRRPDRHRAGRSARAPGMSCFELKGGIGTASRLVEPIDRRASWATPERRRSSAARPWLHGRGPGPDQLRADRTADRRRCPGR